MSQQETRSGAKRAFTTRSVVLIVLIVGLGAGLAAYTIGNTLATNSNQSTQSNLTGTSTLQWNGYGIRGLEGHDWAAARNGTFTSFRALSTINNVTVTGFSITNSNHITGVNFEGPAPRPLERYAIRLGDDGQIVVDKGRKFQRELGQWNDPDSFIKV